MENFVNSTKLLYCECVEKSKKKKLKNTTKKTKRKGKSLKKLNKGV